ncbi:hypothetical protein [Thiothrix winogradskyi]|uniref:Uncharacterized protein n=1 Tax=Thiothrix winogradskyi TaxID=96472 RepID=A0ABY3SVY7_9GAMM|nr:hypothetical protein [Thiothrix winogradskyi]UJS22794.1 hypothetical protein L2Y54_12660 [Thiothrix winogradskyi]
MDSRKSLKGIWKDKGFERVDNLETAVQESRNELYGSMLKLTEEQQATKKSSLLAFAGVGHGGWGETPDVISESIHNLRNSWIR